MFVTVVPVFTSPLPPKQTKTENETVSYSCITQAKPAATVLWKLNGKNLPEASPYNFSVSVAPIPQSKLLRTWSYLTIDRVSWRENGTFSCLAYNDAGEKSLSTELEVRCKYRPVLLCNVVSTLYIQMYLFTTSCCQYAVPENTHTSPMEGFFLHPHPSSLQLSGNSI